MDHPHPRYTAEVVGRELIRLWSGLQRLKSILASTRRSRRSHPRGNVIYRMTGECLNGRSQISDKVRSAVLHQQQSDKDFHCHRPGLLAICFVVFLCHGFWKVNGSTTVRLRDVVRFGQRWCAVPLQSRRASPKSLLHRRTSVLPGYPELSCGLGSDRSRRARMSCSIRL